MAVVTVMVPATLIEDGGLLPVLGENLVYPAVFVEVPEVPEVADDVGVDDSQVVVEQVTAEPQFGGRPQRRQPLGGEPYGDPFWVVLLRAPGWTASWTAPRPVAGPVMLRGVVLADWDVAVHAEARVAGRVVRVRVVSHIVEYTPGGVTSERRLPGTRQLRDVTESPRWFARGAPARPDLRPSRWVSEDGVLVDLVDLVADGEI